MFKVGFIFACGSVFVALSPAVVLYDAANGLARPDSAAWLWQYGASSPSGAVAVVTPPAAGQPYTTLDTSANSDISAGWGRLSPIILDRTAGYRANWEVEIESSGLGDNRGGFSVIVLGSDHRGVELAFGSGRIAAYNDDDAFTLGEGFDLDLTSMRSYALTVQADAYRLSIDGVERLTGNLRLYNQALPPYNIANFLFVGDDTSRQSSVSRFKSFSVEAVPEPATMAVLGLGALGIRKRKRRVA